MGEGIIVCGLNGSGKSTVGKALASALGYAFIDNENLYFSRKSNTDPYENERSREDVERLLMEEVKEKKNFVFAAVKGDYGTEIQPYYDFAVVIEVEKEIRMQRVINRSFLKFGQRMRPGGDLYEKEEAFFRVIENRPEDYAENWVKGLCCPILRIDGKENVDANVAKIVNWIRKEKEKKE